MILLCSLVIIIFLHELGHFIAARWCNCGVKTFSIGFGKPIFQWKNKNTTFQIAPILLGGFCDLFGELSYSRSKFAFTNKTYSQKVFIAYAGIIMNIMTGILSYGIWMLTFNDVFMIFAWYSILIGASNALPIPALDGSFPIAFLFEKKLGKKKLYSILTSLFGKWFKWIMVLNILSLPWLAWLLWKGYIL